MNISEHNRKVAISRWSKVQAKERAKINTSEDASILKALLCGMLAGDGMVRHRITKGVTHHEVHCFPDDKTMLNDFLVSLRFIYDKKAHVKQYGNMYAARINSRTIYEDLIANACFGIKRWKIPSFKSNDHRAAWLRGFFSAEAYVGPKVIKIQTVNKEGMNGVSEFLTQLDIGHSRYEYQPKNVVYSKVYIICIMRKEERSKFLQKVGFSHECKTRKLEQALAL